VWLPSCVGYTPDPLEPRDVLELLARRGEQDLHVEAAGPWQPTWFPLASEVTVADGLTLAEANALALTYSPAVRAAHAEARIAGALLLQAGVLGNPQLFLGPRISPRDSELIFPASLSWELPLWGKLGAEADVARARLTEPTLAVAEIELAALISVREGYLRLARLRRQEELLTTLETSSRRIVDWVEGLVRAGETDAVTAFLARTERDAASAALVDVRTDAARTRRELFELLGLLPDTRLQLVLDGEVTSLPELPEPDRQALLAVPALRAAEAGHATAEAALRLEISKQYPGIRFGPEFEDDRGEPTIGIGIGITLPIFDRNRGGIAAAEEARSRAREAYSAKLLRAAHAEARARVELESAERRLQIHREGVLRSAGDASRALEARLRAGRADVVEVLAAQRSIAQARMRELELEEQIAAASLSAAVEGGLALQRPTSTAPASDPENKK